MITLPDHFKAISTQVKANTRILEYVALNFNYCKMNEENINYLLESFINLHLLIDSEKLKSSTFNKVELHLSGNKMSDFKKII